jgi:hypothetical protein
LLVTFSELYFDMEMKQLEAIWADSSTQWNFDFNHRNEIQSNMNGAFNAQAELLFQLQDQQYKEMLAEAQASVAHMEDVVSKYEGQVRKICRGASLRNFQSPVFNNIVCPRGEVCP